MLERVRDLDLVWVMDPGWVVLPWALLKTLLGFVFGGLYWQPKKIGTSRWGPLVRALMRPGLRPILLGLRKADQALRSLCFTKRLKLGTYGMIDKALSMHPCMSLSL